MRPELILNLLIWLPMVAGLALLAWPRKPEGQRNNGQAVIGSVAMAAVLGLAIYAWRALGSQPWTVQQDWLTDFGIRYALHLDGVNMILVVLIAFAGWLGLAATSLDERLDVPTFTGGMLLTVAGMMGTVLASDLFLFYVFWELMLLPFFLMIGVWGGDKRIKATLKFAVMTIAGSFLMFAAMLYVVWQHHVVTGVWSFALNDLLSISWGTTEGLWLFAAFAIAFGIKAPIFPLHAWQPDTYVEAPWPVTFVLAAAMSKLGIYGFVRFAYPLFPEAAQAAMPVMMTVAAIGVAYGGLLAIVQTDLKRLVAYASFSHLSLIAFGLFALQFQGVHGTLVHMLGHGLTTGGIFLVLMMVAQRTGTTEIAKLSGLAKAMPWLSAAFLVITFGSIGLPGLNGFVGEVLLLVGGFTRHPGLGIVAVTGVILSAAYMLWAVQRAWFGPMPEGGKKLPDLLPGEAAILIPVVALVIGFGLCPKPLLETAAPGARWFLEQVNPAANLNAEEPADLHAAGGAQ